MAMKAMKSATKTMATKAMKAIQAKTATKTMSTRTMKAKTAMKTMSTRAMKAKKAKTALKTMSKKAMKAKKAIGAGTPAVIVSKVTKEDYHAVKNAILKANKTALKTMSKKAMQAMKAKKVGRKSQAMKTKKVGLNKQDDPLGPIDLALSIHEDRHDSPKRPIAPMALRTQRLHQANNPKKMTKKAMESAGTQAVSPKRFRAATAIEKPRAVKNLFPSDFEVWGDEYKDQKPTTDDECIAVAKCHDDDLTQGLEETWHHNGGAKYHARTVTVPAGSIVQFLGPVQLTVHPNKPNDKEEKQEEEVVV